MQVVRPKLQEVITRWLDESLENQTLSEPISGELCWRWSPLFETEPMGVVTDQPSYINAVVVINGGKLGSLKPSNKTALKLLKHFLTLEKTFGRDRKYCHAKWEPRTLDLDLLAWGDLQVKNKNLTLPHPRIIERSFVALPLAEALLLHSKYPKRLPPEEKWPE